MGEQRQLLLWVGEGRRLCLVFVRRSRHVLSGTRQRLILITTAVVLSQQQGEEAARGLRILQFSSHTEAQQAGGSWVRGGI